MGIRFDKLNELRDGKVPGSFCMYFPLKSPFPLFPIHKCGGNVKVRKNDEEAEFCPLSPGGRGSG